VEGKKGTFVEWERERREYCENRGIKLEEMERKKEDGELRWEDIGGREKRRQREERWEGINNSEYNKWYKEIKGKGIPGYLKKEWGENGWRRVARFRLGSEVRGERYWEDEEERECTVAAESILTTRFLPIKRTPGALLIRSCCW